MGTSRIYLLVLSLMCSVCCLNCGLARRSKLFNFETRTNDFVGSDQEEIPWKNVESISGTSAEPVHDVFAPSEELSKQVPQTSKRVRRKADDVDQERELNNTCAGQDEAIVWYSLAAMKKNHPFGTGNEDNSLECGWEAGFSLSVREQIVSFRVPCCARNCHYVLWIETELNKIIIFEFLEVNMPDLKIINHDGSERCLDSFVSFHNTVLVVCGTTIPKPLTAYHTSSTYLSVVTAQNVACNDEISFKLKYTTCEKEKERDPCQSQHTIVEEGKSGFITSPGYRPTEFIPDAVACDWEILVSNHSVIQLSFDSYYLLYDNIITVSAKTDSLEEDKNAINVHFFSHYTNEISYHYLLTLPSNSATVSFRKYRRGANSGFIMRYKAVSKINYIPIINALKVNCTGHHSPLPAHVLCDFRDDCVGREDERNCSYENEELCPGGQIFESSCYYQQSQGAPVSWKKAERICEEHYNGHLITPNSVQELTFIVNLITRNPMFWVDWYVGIRRMSYDSDLIYRRLYQGMDGTTLFHTFDQRFTANTAECTVYSYPPRGIGRPAMSNIACQKVWTDISRITIKHPDMQIACESKIGLNMKQPIRPSSPHNWTKKIETFQCRNGSPLWYSHVCDGVQDCLDNSDEEFCLPVPDEDPDIAVCSDGVAVPSSSWCDAKPDCLDASDEMDCLSCNGDAILCPPLGCLPRHWADDESLDCPLRDAQGQWIIEPGFVARRVLAPPAVGAVMPDGYGKVTIKPLNEGNPCPATHARCHKGYCIPIYMLCNGHKDCPDGEDELLDTCKTFCKGRYKCHKSSICLHDDHVCDGWLHCPHQDDESFCVENSTCPFGCFCSAKEVSCHSGVAILDLGCVKRLDISNSTSDDISSLSVENHCIISLIAQNSSIREVNQLNMVNLYKMDLSGNLLGHLEKRIFLNISRMRELSLARNKFTEIGFEPFRFLEKLELLDISGNPHERLAAFSFKGCSHLKILHLDDMGITKVDAGAFSGLPELRVLTLKGNPISIFQPDIFSHVPQLSSLKSDNCKLCCPLLMPQSLSARSCEAPKDEISSCEDILRTPCYRVFLWLMVAVTIVGNSAVLVYKFCIERKPSTRGYNTFITSLSASDLLMGIYLAIIGTADQIYAGQYFWRGHVWKSSIYCSLAGFLSMTSSEVSALTICLVSLDRYLGLACPLSNIQISQYTARFLVLTTWAVGVIVAGLPLSPPLSHWHFYSQNGVCIPLPITRVSFPGSNYSFVIFIVVNFIMFVGIAVGQILIFRSVRLSTREFKDKAANRRQQDIAIAQKLAFVVLTDFLCWFPIGVMGILAKAGVPVPGEVNVVSTIFILPLNSALNPYLYTLPAVRQTLRKKKSLTETDACRKPRWPPVTWNRSKTSQSPGNCGMSSPSKLRGTTTISPTATPEVCLAKLRKWLKTGRVSTDTVTRILSRCQTKDPSVMNPGT